MNVDVQIYLSEFKRFFNQNPDDLANLIPLNQKDKFYEMVSELAAENEKNGKEIPLTQKQLIDVCVEINGVKKKTPKLDPSIIETIYGNIFLN